MCCARKENLYAQSHKTMAAWCKSLFRCTPVVLVLCLIMLRCPCNTVQPLSHRLCLFVLSDRLCCEAWFWSRFSVTYESQRDKRRGRLCLYSPAALLCASHLLQPGRQSPLTVPSMHCISDSAFHAVAPLTLPSMQSPLDSIFYFKKG